jgi:D-amino-acid oxidase
LLKPCLALGGPGIGAYAAAGPKAGPGYGRQMGGREVDVLVIGAGVSGLTTAVCLAEAGLAVDVAATRPPRRTTSAAAGAIWGPHLVGMDERVARWGQVTLARLRHLADDPATGVRAVSGITCFRAARPPEPPAWTDGVGERARCEDAELPAGFTCGWRFTAPVISMPVYLGYLLARFLSAGGQVQDDCAFASLAAAAGQASADVIVNCSGIGAHDLVPDPAVLPVRGQVVVTANPGISEFFIGVGEAPGDIAYLFPHEDTVVLGGTEQPGDWNQQPDPATAERILRQCAAIDPRLRHAAVLAHRVGLRPARPVVRLEAEDTGDGRLLLHNYGHGGAGVTLSWGCALEITGAVLDRGL